MRFRSSVAQGVMGGLIFDALILATAKAGAVDEQLAFNARHFQSLDTGQVRVVTP